MHRRAAGLGLAALLLVAGSANAAPRFAAPLILLDPGNGDDGVYATSVALADFNGDGLIDLVSGGWHDGVNVTLLDRVGQPMPTPSTGRATYPGGPPGVPYLGSVMNFATGDLDGDGHCDLVVAGYTTDSLAVLLGDGAGGLQRVGNVFPGFTTTLPELMIGDLDGDGVGDLVAVAGDTLTVLLGNGDGTFRITSIVHIDGGLAGFTLCDVDRDHHLDVVVVTDTTHAIAVLRGRGDGGLLDQTFYPMAIAAASSMAGVTVGDFDNDGAPDVAVAGARLSIFLNDGFGRFLPPMDGGPVSPGGNGWGADANTSIACADLDHDGALDLVALGVGALQGVGDGTFTPFPPLTFSPNAVGFAIGDLNHDGVLDLVVADAGLGIVEQWGNGDGTFGTPLSAPIGSAAPSLAIADLNGDGLADVVTGGMSVLLAEGEGRFKAAVYYGTPGAVAIADLNGDGVPDIVSGGGAVFLGTGDGSFGAPIPLRATGDVVAIRDLDADGKPDCVLVTCGTGGQFVTVLLGKGDGTFGPPTSYGTGVACDDWGEGARGIVVDDLNGDGIPDVEVYGAQSSPDGDVAALVVLPGLGNGSLGVPAPPKALTKRADACCSYGLSVGEGEVAGVRYLFSSYEDVDVGCGGVGVSGGGRTWGHWEDVDVPQLMALTDADGDSLPDVAVATTNWNVVEVESAQADGRLASTYYGLPNEISALAFGDVTGDGQPDLVVMNGTQLTVLRNLAPPVAASSRTVPPRLLAIACAPNPVRTTATFAFTLGSAGEATLRVYDVQGRCVATPAQGRLTAGHHRITWDRRSASGAVVPPGVYLTELREGHDHATERVVVLGR